MKNKLIDGLISNNNKEELKEGEDSISLEEALQRVDMNDPKVHFKQLSILKKYSLKKKKVQIEIDKYTRLNDKEEGQRKFRKQQELVFLMKQIK